MEALFFFLLIFTAISVVAYFMTKSSRATKTELSQKEKQIQSVRRQRADKLATPGSARLSDSEEVWRARRRHVALASESADKTEGSRYLKYKVNEEPGYDGYSRSDRHHVTPARIMRERHLDDIVLPGDQPKRAEKSSQPRLTP